MYIFVNLVIVKYFEYNNNNWKRYIFFKQGWLERIYAIGSEHCFLGAECRLAARLRDLPQKP